MTKAHTVPVQAVGRRPEVLKSYRYWMANTTIILHVESVKAKDGAVPTTDIVVSQNEVVQSTDIANSGNKTVLKTDLATTNSGGDGLTASVTSNSNAGSCTNHTINDNAPASVSVSVNSSSTSKKPDTVLFIVVYTENSQCVSVLVPREESIELGIHGDLPSMVVYAYGLQRHNKHALEWYTVLSHSHLSIGSSASFREKTDVRSSEIFPVQMPALMSKDIRNCLPFHAKKSIPANVIQDKWAEDQYTVTGLHGGLTFIQWVPEGTTSILLNRSNVTDVVIPFPLRSTSDFEVHVMAVPRQSGNVFNGCLPATKLSFRTKMKQQDVDELYGKAVSYMYHGYKYPRFGLLPYLYRNKPAQYFYDIFNKQSGWMNTYIKNDGGDPASVLNGRINGLFFSAVLEESTRLPPPSSPFGSARLCIPTLLVFSNRMNMYFADFYCHSTKKRHKVQLVLTPKGSDEDIFCRQRLVYLNPYNNPFFFKEVHPDGSGLVRAVVTVNVVVEIFLTMNLNIIQLQRLYPGEVFIRDTEATTSGFSMVRGLPKCPSCTVCNLSRFC